MKKGKMRLNKKTERLAGLALMTAVIIVLQVFSTYLTNVTANQISITFALVPIVIGAALYGVGAGAYLGAVFSATVLLLSVLLIMLKGTAAGLAAGLVYRALEKKNKVLATFAAAVVSPLVNTFIFVFGLFLFFRPVFNEWAKNADSNVFLYFFTFVIGLNFIIELLTNVILSPVIVRIVDVVRKNKS